MKRNCLKCNKKFESIHKGNRICTRCNKENTTISTIKHIYYETKQKKLNNIK